MIEVRFGGQIPIQDSLISGEPQRSTKLGSDPKTVISGEQALLQGPLNRGRSPISMNADFSDVMIVLNWDPTPIRLCHPIH
jgi:hypothetical protein